MTQWHLAQVKPNADKIATRNLERQNFLTFQPLERRTQVRGGRFVTSLRPFFPGYIFLSCPEAAAPWSLVNSTYGVARLVSFGGKPAPVPEGIIAGLMAACGEDGTITVSHQLQPGDLVAVTSGPFASLVGKIVRLTPDQRALVLIDFMGKQTRVRLPATDLRPAAALSHARVAAQ
ncbi:MAG: transcriptional activator RfaH [Erythrobacter sp.]|jgi:transcriptional antiterminator RfaH|nr:transcriptional activator RfaH [Erythrobacter sp.]